MRIADYSKERFDNCLMLFDKNCPQFFAENERKEYSNYLMNLTDSYKVVLSNDTVIAAFGIRLINTSNRCRITWIMVCPNEKGKGLGTKLMAYIKQYAQEAGSVAIDIAASHLSAPFFAQFDAKEITYLHNGWGVDMHRVDMAINL
ncbi:hypothetical protein tinsulaeT_16190 [Thalassotalea insulae]|uniref:N-acetyltransferase domain-containing protein n=1 Tax=Thalassotalea insulae TaxID=2056778 RepID=A0ABQ6GSZ0_9GAMM|nr:GNAT family N-acetyltransferase [Thalassotalea insulae]GLX78279.1 hypothetical protein tinsulaeT_16190 [Thalassotalea insulae]